MSAIRKITVCLTCLGVSSLSVASQIFTILPDRTHANISGLSYADYQINWVVTNNLNIATPIQLIHFGTGRSEAGFTLLSTTCNQPVEPHASCEMKIGITGSEMQESQVVMSPKVCGVHGQACAQPIASHRVSLTKINHPVPQGSWRSISNTSVTSFPEFISIHYPGFVVGVMNQNYMPTVVQCPNINSEYGCTVLLNGLLDYHFNGLNYLTYTSHGDIMGVFQQERPDAGNPATTYLMQYSQVRGTWTPYADPFVGETEGFAMSTASDVYTASTIKQFSSEVQDYINVGLSTAWMSGGSTYANIFALSAGLNNIVSDGLGHVFVSGLSIPSGADQAMSLIWQWNPILGTFDEINMPNNIPTITDMVSDGQGTIYISGLDYESIGRVWRYTSKTNVFTDLGLTASTVSTLTFSPYGYLLAGGTDSHGLGAIWYYTQGSWVNMNIPDSSVVVSIAADANNDIMATGIDTNNDANIWVYNESVNGL